MAIAFRKQVDADTEIALWRIEEDADTLYHKLQLNEQEKAYVDQLANGKRHLHWLGTRVLLRTMLNTTNYIDCRIDTHGKPYLYDMPYHISLSHSFDYAAVMISKSRPVGIDIEQIKQKVERIAPKFLRHEEQAAIDADNKIAHLYVCWCAKEAIYKCYGQKEVSFLDNIALERFPFTAEGSLQAHLHKGELHIDYKVDFLQYEDYMIGYVKA
ncbi:4'-phosphopantetheinyl transferase superfamily protein [Mucilaginibacter sp. PAMB04274]|uniref:4'-phosphopantetheinyl transferase family protein n=1 Tax=Mucilaginibacter sp. PAMB04274 TaxID=3138568 RepID=UPI0031F64760